MKFKFRFIPVLLVLFCISLPAFAQGNADAIISYRKNVMKAVGGHTGALFTIVKGGLGDYKDQMLYHAKALHESSGNWWHVRGPSKVLQGRLDPGKQEMTPGQFTGS